MLAAAASAAAESPGFLPGTPKIGIFVPTVPPREAPPVSFADVHGRPVSLAFFKGEPVVLNFWATWCAPCAQEMPSLDKLQSDFAGKLAVVAIDEDLGGANTAQPFLARFKLKALKPYLDPKSDVATGFGVRALPTSIVIDKTGKVVGIIEGKAEWGSAELRALLQPLVAGAAVVKSSLR